MVDIIPVKIIGEQALYSMTIQMGDLVEQSDQLIFVAAVSFFEGFRFQEVLQENLITIIKL
jgi:hypothetical protein